MHHGHKNKHCKKSCHSVKECKPKCHSPVKRCEKFDSFSEEEQGCSTPRCYERKLVLTQVVCEQDKNIVKRWGHCTKQEGDWCEIKCDGRLKNDCRPCKPKPPCKAIKFCDRKAPIHCNGDRKHHH